MDLEERATCYTHLHNSGQHEEAFQLANEVSDQGLMPKYNLDDQTFSFVDADTYINTPPGNTE